MKFDFLFKKKGNDLDKNNYFNYCITKEQLSILESEEHERFKNALLEVMEAKMAENIFMLIHNKNKELDDLYRGVALVYEDLITLFRKEDIINKKRLFQKNN